MRWEELFSVNVLKSRNLLLIVPHFKVFIKDQAMLIRPNFNKIIVLMPFPYFSNLALLPYLRKHFSFLRWALESRAESSQGCELISPKYFTLPVEALRKRNCYLATRSCIKALSKNPISFSLIHAHFLYNGFIGEAFKSLSGKPLIVTAHGSDVYDLPFRDNWYETLAKHILRKADQIITVSQFNAKKLLLLGVQSAKINVIPNGFDEKLFRPASSFQARSRLGVPHNKKLLLSIGSLEEMKGYAYLIDAMSFISRARRDVLLVIVGSGSLKEKLLRRIKKLGLEQNILLAGRKTHDEIPTWINASDFFVLPSLGEGFPTVLPEAMACGKPVIGTEVGGVSEIITNQEVGMLVSPKDAEALASTIIEALQKKWWPEIILNHAKQYSWSHLIPQIISTYEKVL